MQDTLNIRQMLRQPGAATGGEAVFNFEGRDFLGFAATGPVRFCWRAGPLGQDTVRLDLRLEATVQGECVRCLTPFSRAEAVEKSYDIQPADLEGEYPEYPATPDGQLDLEELAYGELVLEVSPILVCREDCPGLCPTCGRPRAECGCGAETGKDPRWQALWPLLEEDGDNE